jgi:hypothetical protein
VLRKDKIHVKLIAKDNITNILEYINIKYMYELFGKEISMDVVNNISLYMNIARMNEQRKKRDKT